MTPRSWGEDCGMGAHRKMTCLPFSSSLVWNVQNHKRFLRSFWTETVDASYEEWRNVPVLLWKMNLLLHPAITTVAFSWRGTVHVARSLTRGFPFTWSFSSVQIWNNLVPFPLHLIPSTFPVILTVGKLQTSVEGLNRHWVKCFGFGLFF